MDKNGQNRGRPVTTHLTDKQLAQVDEMCLCNCKDYTIAEVIGIKVDTLKRNYGKRLIQKRAEGRFLLQKQQKNKCEKGDTTMLIWRGKQILGQTDKQEIAGKNGKPIVVNLVLKNGIMPRTN